MEKTVDNNKYIRDLTKYIYSYLGNYIDSTYHISDDYSKKNIFLSSLTLNSYESRRRQLSKIFNIEEESIIKTSAIITMIQYQLYIDYYKKLNLDKKLKRNFQELSEITFEKLNNSNTPKEIVGFVSLLDTHIPYCMLDTMLEYDKTSVYEKILQVKALDSEQVQKLVSINPFFETEVNKYDIDISLSFIKDRINRLNTGTFSDNKDRVYNETADFIYNLSKIRKKEAACLLDEIIMESENIKLSSNSNDKDMKCSYGYISKNELKSLLVTMTKQENIPVKEKK